MLFTRCFCVVFYLFHLASIRCILILFYYLRNVFNWKLICVSNKAGWKLDPGGLSPNLFVIQHVRTRSLKFFENGNVWCFIFSSTRNQFVIFDVIVFLFVAFVLFRDFCHKTTWIKQTKPCFNRRAAAKPESNRSQQKNVSPWNKKATAVSTHLADRRCVDGPGKQRAKPITHEFHTDGRGSHTPRACAAKDRRADY